MVKITTRQQFTILIQQMEANPSLAHGVRGTGETKLSIQKVWKEIARKLNNYGPPMRTVDEWQRVWIHFKAKLKKKMAQSKRNLNNIDGETSHEVTFSSLEQATANLLQNKVASPLLDTSSYDQDNDEVIGKPPMLKIKKMETSQHEDSNEAIIPELKRESDSFEHLGLAWAAKLRKMQPTQSKLAERLISEILFQGDVGILNLDTTIQNSRYSESLTPHQTAADRRFRTFNQLSSSNKYNLQDLIQEPVIQKEEIMF